MTVSISIFPIRHPLKGFTVSASFQIKNGRLQNEKLKVKILAKDKELVTNSLQIAKKNKILNGIIQKLKDGYIAGTETRCDGTIAYY